MAAHRASVAAKAEAPALLLPASPDLSRFDQSNNSGAGDDAGELLCFVADDDAADDGFEAPAAAYDQDGTGSETGSKTSREGD